MCVKHNRWIHEGSERQLHSLHNTGMVAAGLLQYPGHGRGAETPTNNLVFKKLTRAFFFNDIFSFVFLA